LQRAQQNYGDQVKWVFDGLTADQLDEEARQRLWLPVDEALAAAFRGFAVSNVSEADRKKQQTPLYDKLGLAVTQMLLSTLSGLERDEIEAGLLQLVDQTLERWRAAIGSDDLREYEQWLFLSTIDREWQQYLEEINDLRTGISLESFGQRNPKVEYKRRALEMFEDLRTTIQRTIVDHFFRQLPYHQQFITERRARAELRERAARGNYRVEQRRSGGITVRRDTKVNRNDPCPCGSGKKYKNCHGRPGAQPAAEGSAAESSRAASQGKQRK
jgi:preprotein translocase subunit SecA